MELQGGDGRAIIELPTGERHVRGGTDARQWRGAAGGQVRVRAHARQLCDATERVTVLPPAAQHATFTVETITDRTAARE